MHTFYACTENKITIKEAYAINDDGMIIDMEEFFEELSYEVF